MQKFQKIIDFIRSLYPGEEFIPLHRPIFKGKELAYMQDALDSGLISTYGPYIEKLEELFRNKVGTEYAVPLINGTAALHIALVAIGVVPEDEVITQGLTFIATANAITYTGATPIFIDIDPNTYGLSAPGLAQFLETHAKVKKGECFNRFTRKRIKACVPVHSFGFPCEIDKITEICENWNIALIEDAAESLGSYYKEKHTGSFGEIGIFSFNGNKTITSGGGGILVTNNDKVTSHVRHLVRHARLPNNPKYNHDMVGYNYEMPNINAAIACAQMENLKIILEQQKLLAKRYDEFFSSLDISMLKPISHSNPNHWLNGIFFSDSDERDAFLSFSIDKKVQCKEAWMLLDEKSIYGGSWNDGLATSRQIHDRLVNIPSGIPVVKNTNKN